MALSESSNQSGGFLVRPARTRVSARATPRPVAQYKLTDHRAKTKRKVTRG